MKHIIIALFALSIFTSCSVVMAAKKDGTSIEKVQNARTRNQFFSIAKPCVISSCWNEEGDLVETYQIKKERGSAARAFMHGCLDVATFGVWEAVGTPIEGIANQQEYFVIRVIYDQNEVVKRVELL